MLYIFERTLIDGISAIPWAWPILKTVPWILLITLLKLFFGGARNKADRLLHSKVVMVTGGTSGVGAAVVHDLASRGAQIILLTQHPPADPFIVEYIEDVRRSTGNQLVYAEQVDLSSLHSIRTFATKWIDNAPPRRLDMVILCASTMSPRGEKKGITVDGLDEEWQINYLSNFHLLSILSPALRAQPADRDVRVILATCSSYIGAELDFKTLDDRIIPQTPSKLKSSRLNLNPGTSSQSSMYATSKLALMIFAKSFQSHLSAYNRPDKTPPNARVLLVDPGLCRTPGTRRWITRGSLWGLLLYLVTWPIWWLVLKSPQQGAQSFLMAAMETGFSMGASGGVDLGLREKFGVSARKMLKECLEREVLRREIGDEGVEKALWEFSDKVIERREKEGAVRRAVERKERESMEAEKKKQEEEGEDATTEGRGGNKERTPGSRRSRKAKA